MSPTHEINALIINGGYRVWDILKPRHAPAKTKHLEHRTQHRTTSTSTITKHRVLSSASFPFQQHTCRAEKPSHHHNVSPAGITRPLHRPPGIVSHRSVRHLVVVSWNQPPERAFGVRV
jgi:hypothetical protein